MYISQFYYAYKIVLPPVLWAGIQGEGCMIPHGLAEAASGQVCAFDDDGH